FLCNPGGGNANVPGDGESLTKHWRFSHNCRDGSGGDSILRRAAGDQLLDKVELASRKPADPDFARPAPGTAWAKQGAGDEDQSLPGYVGAVPPKGIERWDWDRTWQARSGASRQKARSSAGDK